MKKFTKFIQTHRITIIRAVLIALIIALMAVIFGFSAQDGEQSSGVSSALMQSLMKIVGIDPEGLSLKALETAETVLRKLGHFSEYAVLGALVCLLILTYRVKRWRCIAFATAFSAVYAGLDELHQMFVPERSALFTDVLIDTLGALCGSAAALALLILTAKAVKRITAKKKKA